MVSPKVGSEDVFEQNYKQRFKSLMSSSGEFVNYERDRAALDLGVHLTNQTNRRFRTLANARVWFQLKGRQATTLPLARFKELDEVKVRVSLDDLRFWYASPEAVYLALYIESADLFLVDEIRDIVDRKWGESIFHAKTFPAGQRTTTLSLPKSATFGDQTVLHMRTHRTLRIDGPSFRGRPLGHRLDPLRCILERLNPSDFLELTESLLSAHGFKEHESINTTACFPGAPSQSLPTVRIGVMNYTFEWVQQNMTQFGYSADSEFRIEGQVFHVQGPCAVLVDCSGDNIPDRAGLTDLIAELAARKVTDLLVFVNSKGKASHYGSYFSVARLTKVRCLPEFLEDLAFNVLTATTVYLEHRHRMRWSIVNYLY